MQLVSTTAASSVEYVIDMIFFGNKSKLAFGHLMFRNRRRRHDLPAVKPVVEIDGLSRAASDDPDLALSVSPALVSLL
jgi:hypothetical protein